MNAILGIDAAWTPRHPSGVALLRQNDSRDWECVGVESSYAHFLAHRLDRAQNHERAQFPAADLLDTAKELAGNEVSLVVADIPLSTKPITGRRSADNKISAVFGGRGCSAHSPSANRPGLISESIRKGFEERGFSLAINQASLPKRALIESYPHPALLSLMKASYRVPYKVGKSKTYYRKLGLAERLEKIAAKLEDIVAALSSTISGIEIRIPKGQSSFAALKPVEDKIDALVCAWVGIQVLEGRAMSIGDNEGAIWLPADLLPSARTSEWSNYLASGAQASEEFMDGIEDLPVE
jgi:predicted RNase H-like nuclease